MKLASTPLIHWRWAALFLSALFACAYGAQAEDLKFEVQLIWATNDEKSPNSKHKEVDAEIRKKLDELPLKWKNYFSVNRKQFSVSDGGTTKSPVSEKCQVVVKDIDGKKIEIKLLNKNGEVVLTRTQPLPKNEILVLGGNAPDKTAWLVTLKRTD